MRLKLPASALVPILALSVILDVCIAEDAQQAALNLEADDNTLAKLASWRGDSVPSLEEEYFDEYYDATFKHKGHNEHTKKAERKQNGQVKWLVPDCPIAKRLLNQVYLPNGPPPYGTQNRVKPKPNWWYPPPLSGPSILTAADYVQLIDTIKAACDAGQLSPPALFRLGFHSQWLAAAVGRSYGSNGGYLRYALDYNDPANAGLNDTVVYLVELRNAKFPGITFADLFTLAGSIGPEIAGGPPIAWYPGRLDSTAPGPSNPSLSAALPNPMLDAQGVETINEQIMRFTVRETVIYFGGGHSFGGGNASGWNGIFTPFADKWPQPSNLYFIDLINEEWVLVANEGSNKPQYVRAQDAFKPITTETVFRTPAGFSLREAEVFARWSRYYAVNEAAFTRDLQRTYQRAMQLGAGYTFDLLPQVFQWRGFAGTFDGFGTDILPMDDNYDKPVIPVRTKPVRH